MTNTPRFPPMPTAITTGDSGTPVLAVRAPFADDGGTLSALIAAAKRVPIARRGDSEPWTTCLGCGQVDEQSCKPDCWVLGLEIAIDEAERRASPSKACRTRAASVVPPAGEAPLTNEKVLATATRLVFDEVGDACASVEAETLDAGHAEVARECIRRIAAIRSRTLYRASDPPKESIIRMPPVTPAEVQAARRYLGWKFLAGQIASFAHLYLHAENEAYAASPDQEGSAEFIANDRKVVEYRAQLSEYVREVAEARAEHREPGAMQRAGREHAVTTAWIDEAIGALEASIVDGEVDFEDITSPEGTRDCALETLKQVRDALGVPKVDDGDPRTPAYGVGGGR